MGVIDFEGQDPEESDALTEAGRSGRFSGGYLAEEPLRAYLGSDERVRYVLASKTGVRIERERGETPLGRHTSEETVDPDDGYRAMAAITDVRILFVVGREDGDWSATVPMEMVVTAGTEDGFLSGTLSVSTVRDERWTFECRGALEPVAEYVDDAAQSWNRAHTLLDEAEASAEKARRTVADTARRAAFEEAEATLDDAAENVERAREEVAWLGDAARSTVGDRAEAIERLLATSRRDVRTTRGLANHALGVARWIDGEYERARDRYEEARRAYGDALTVAENAAATDAAPSNAPDGTPDDATILARTDRLDREIRALEAAPVAVAEATVAAAEGADDPAVAAAHWETTLEAYREAYALDWGRERRFDGDRERLRERAAEAAGRAIDERLAAARKSLAAASWHDVVGDDGATADAIDRAREQFRRAHGLATEFLPDRERDVREARRTATDELPVGDDREASDGEGDDRDETDSEQATGSDDPMTVLIEALSGYGWTITRTPAADYDALATIEEPIRVRAVVHMLDHPDAVVGPEAVEACTRTRDEEGADLAVIATTGSVSTTARELAEETGVRLVDPSDPDAAGLL